MELIAELDTLRARVKELEKIEAERPQVETELRNSEARYRAIFETTGTATIIIGDDTKIVLANAEFEKLSGYERAELEHSHCWPDFITPGDRERMLDYHRQRRIDPASAPRNYECRFITRTGECRDLYVTIAMIPGTRQSVASFLDVTESRRAEERLRKHKERLARVSRLGMMGELASSLAHELNQPLCAILGCGEIGLRMLKTGSHDVDQVVEAMEEVVAQADRAGKIIRRIRQFVRGHTPKRAPVDVNGLVKDALALVEADAQRRGIAIRLDLEQHNVVVSVDGIEIQQVVLNLVRNAMEAMDARETEERELTVEVRAPGDEPVEIAIHDTGCGVPSAEVERIFEPFFTTKRTGMGIGLPLSRSIIEHHGGHLWATPRPDRGTTFRFTLPRSDQLR